MKVLDVDALHQGINDIQAKLQTTNEQMKQVQKDVEGLISMEASFKGKGGQAIRSYYQECHLPLLTFFESFVVMYNQTLQRTKKQLQELEPSYGGFIRQDFLENELEHGLQTANHVTKDLTDEANRIIQSVSDIISLPRLNDDEFALHIRQAEQQKYETIEKLYDFDYQQTQALTNVRQELEKMQQYVRKISSMFKSGDINISRFKIDQLDDVKAYQDIQVAVRSKDTSQSINNVWGIPFGQITTLLSVQHQFRNQLSRLMPFSFLTLGNVTGTQPSRYTPQDTFYPFGFKAPPTQAYYTNDGKKVNITNLNNSKNAKSEMEEFEPIMPEMKEEIPILKGEMPWGPGNMGRVVKVVSKTQLAKLIKNKVDKAIDYVKDVTKGNTVSNFAGKINAKSIPNMSKKDILDGLPDNWKYTDNNGFVHIRDGNGNVRMRIDPPDKVTKYDHVHIFDDKGNPLDINLNKVDRKSPDAHIPYKK